MNHSLAYKYRPLTFEEVVGQNHAVNILRNLIQPKQIGRSILFHGTIGSGKTSLARLYGKALNCVEPTDAGSPCNHCEACTATFTGFHEYDVPRRGGGKSAVLDWLDAHDQTPSRHRHQVLFFDEVHALTDEASDALLKRVEEPKDRVLFLFATTEFGKVRRALRSRLIHLEVRPLRTVEAVSFLKQVADREGLRYTDEALILLSGLKAGYPRDLLTGLEQVSLFDGDLTVDRVREFFDIDHIETLITYFHALAAGTYATQSAAFNRWQESASDKAQWVRAFLLTLYHNDILGDAQIIEPITHTISIHQRSKIIRTFRQRLHASSFAELLPYWHRMMEFWSTPVENPDDSTQLLRFALFHDLVNNQLGKHTTSISILDPTSIGPDAINDHGTQHDIQLLASDTHTDYDAQHNIFMELGDVRKIVNTSSFMMQNYDVTFNTSICIRPNSNRSEHEERKIAQSFWQELSSQASKWGDPSLMYISIFERDADGFHSQGLAYLSMFKDGANQDSKRRVDAWIDTWCLNNRAEFPNMELSLDHVRSDRNAVRAHWEAVLRLCGALDPDVKSMDPSTRKPTALIDLLKIPKKDRRDPRRLLSGPVVQTSSSLTAKAIDDASPFGMRPLSAFDEGAWDWVRSGWERKIHSDRWRQIRDRTALVDEINFMYIANPEKQNVEFSRLSGSWPASPEDQYRDHKLWWASRTPR